MYHKALDLQKHDQFEESAKAYHELLEARLLREVRRQQALEPGGLGLTSAPHFSAVTLDTLSLLSALSFPTVECVCLLRVL